MRTHSILVWLAAVALCLVPLELSASPVPASLFITETGDGADGAIDGTPFSSQPWVMEFQVNPAASDSNSSPVNGQFADSIVGGHVKIGSTTYTLAGTSATGQIVLTDASKAGSNGDGLDINPDSGGFVQFQTADNQLFPPLFADNNSLTSAVPGSATVISNTTDSFNNVAVASFQYYPDPFMPFDQRLQTTAGALIELSQADSPAGGHFTLHVGQTSTFATPEPGTFALAAFGALGVMVAAYRRRRA